MNGSVIVLVIVVAVKMTVSEVVLVPAVDRISHFANSIRPGPFLYLSLDKCLHIRVYTHYIYIHCVKLVFSLYIYINVFIHIYINIYIYINIIEGSYSHIYIYTFIYIYIYRYIYIYIYIYM